jgi:hypothetical protein
MRNLTSPEKIYIREIFAFLIQEFSPVDVKTWITRDLRYLLYCYRDGLSVAACVRTLRPEEQEKISKMVDELLREA